MRGIERDGGKLGIGGEPAAGDAVDIPVRPLLQRHRQVVVGAQHDRVQLVIVSEYPILDRLSPPRRVHGSEQRELPLVLLQHRPVLGVLEDSLEQVGLPSAHQLEPRILEFGSRLGVRERLGRHAVVAAPEGGGGLERGIGCRLFWTGRRSGGARGEHQHGRGDRHSGDGTFRARSHGRSSSFGAPQSRAARASGSGSTANEPSGCSHACNRGTDNRAVSADSADES